MWQRQLSKSKCVLFIPLQNECLSTALKVEEILLNPLASYLSRSLIWNLACHLLLFFTPATLALPRFWCFLVLIFLSCLNALSPLAMFFIFTNSASPPFSMEKARWILNCIAISHIPQLFLVGIPRLSRSTVLFLPHYTTTHHQLPIVTLCPRGDARNYIAQNHLPHRAPS